MHSRSRQTIRQLSVREHYFSDTIKEQVDVLTLKNMEDFEYLLVVPSTYRENDHRQVDVLAEVGVRSQAMHIQVNIERVEYPDPFENELRNILQKSVKIFDVNKK